MSKLPKSLKSVLKFILLLFNKILYFNYILNYTSISLTRRLDSWQKPVVKDHLCCNEFFPSLVEGYGESISWANPYMTGQHHPFVAVCLALLCRNTDVDVSPNPYFRLFNSFFWFYYLLTNWFMTWCTSWPNDASLVELIQNNDHIQ